MGQTLTLPIIAIGLLLLVLALIRKPGGVGLPGGRKKQLRLIWWCFGEFLRAGVPRETRG
jgi:hypothetical protein